jgi:hypothetical protein
MFDMFHVVHVHQSSRSYHGGMLDIFIETVFNASRMFPQISLN